MSEQELISRIKQGDQQAFKQIVDDFQAMVLNTCFQFVNDKDDAKDLAQDVFVEMYNSIYSFRGDAKVSTWLYRISVNKSLNFIKKHKRKFLIDDLESFFMNKSEETYNADKNMEDNERAKHLYAAIHSLSKNQRIAFSLHKIDGVSYTEIAEIMNVSISSVESLIHRAKVNLKKKLFNFYKKNIG